MTRFFGGTAPLTVLFSLVLLLCGTAPVRSDDKPDPLAALIRSQVSDPARPFTLLVHIVVKEGRGDDFEKAFAKAIAGTRKEKGVVTYDLSRDPKNGQKYIVYERWLSVAAIESHLQTDHIKTLNQALPEMLDGAPVFHVLIPAGEP